MEQTLSVGSVGMEIEPLRLEISGKTSLRRALYTARAHVLDEEGRIVRAVINTLDVDRFSTVVDPQGAVIENYMKNPVVLWNHYPDFPIGRALELEATKKSIIATWQFFDGSQIPEKGMILQLIEDVWQLYSQGFIRGHSIGFLPLEDEWNEDEHIIQFKKWELLEFSLTPIPANPNALAKAPEVLKRLLRVSEPGQVQEYLLSLPQKERLKLSQHFDAGLVGQDLPWGRRTYISRSKWEQEETTVTKNRIQNVCKCEIRAVVPFQDLPLAERDRPWDGRAAERRVRRWASKDGSGDKDQMNWRKFRQAFLMFNRDDLENFGSYKLPIADVIGGELRAVPRGIFAAAVVLQGGRGGVDEFDEGDIERAKRHLSRYYRKMREEFDDDSIQAPWERERFLLTDDDSLAPLWEVVDILENAPRQGAEVDEPEGSRYIKISDTLAHYFADLLTETAYSLEGLLCHSQDGMRVELGNVEKLEEVRSLLEDIAERAKNLEEFVPQLTAIRDQLSRIINEMEALAEEKEEEALRRASLAAEYEEDLATLLRELRAERKKNQQLAEVLEKLLEVLESEK
jgi:hypothetical protein